MFMANIQRGCSHYTGVRGYKGRYPGEGAVVYLGSFGHGSKGGELGGAGFLYVRVGTSASTAEQTEKNHRQPKTGPVRLLGKGQ